jgi:sulfopropanediol 3-dehydrogenase
MAEHLKRPAAGTAARDERVRRDVAEMLLRIERSGETAVREYSRRLDGWDPPSFLVALDGADEGVPDDLRGHVAFALEQVRGFARAQRATLADLRVEPLPGVVLGHRHLPVGAVGAYVPGGRYPMLASSFMTVAVAKEAGVPHVVGCAPPQRGRGIDPAMLHAMAASGADQVLCLGGVQGLAALAFGLCGVEPVDMLVGAGTRTSPRPSGSSSGRSASTCWPGRPRCWRSPTRPPIRAWSRPTCSGRPSTARPRPPC